MILDIPSSLYFDILTTGVQSGATPPKWRQKECLSSDVSNAKEQQCLITQR